MYIPVNPSFTKYKLGVWGCSLHGLVFVMLGWNGGRRFMDGNNSCAIVADIVQKVLMLL